ncbi:hypothetical protein [Xanthomonas sacchari]|uniref:hypothetical protein n=1 Tax=Xanthomonas sacchari TaxID=56458 RepID=UPI002257C666|nr:hypothetical protein [Xanthomonas sacchari]
MSPPFQHATHFSPVDRVPLTAGHALEIDLCLCRPAFVLRCGIRFFSGLFEIGGLVNAWTLLSFLLCAALFAHLALRVAQHRLAHACLILVIYAAFADVLAALLPPDMTDEPAMFVAVEWLQLLASAGLGLLVG